MIHLDFSEITLRLKQGQEKTNVYDIIRKKWLVLTPEEHVRQYLLHHLISKRKYPQALIAVERKIQAGERFKRFDIVVFSREHQPWMLVECKEPDVNISENTLFQLLNYQRVVQAQYWVLSNGHQTLCADARDISNIKWMEELPVYGL
ncbi:MAG TPA: type I restriction enzyme HsdR N-terminal domain-containing protein [Flavipsychrobacter sp.]|nr:type I restriction enzyme HsdR N-terminal domain-containing protein [Flavipsychrobacter sp.]